MPNTQNLTPREPEWGETKKRRVLYLTDTARTSLEQVAESLGYRSLSDLVERLGRKTLTTKELREFLKSP